MSADSSVTGRFDTPRACIGCLIHRSGAVSIGSTTWRAWNSCDCRGTSATIAGVGERPSPAKFPRKTTSQEGIEPSWHTFLKHVDEPVMSPGWFSADACLDEECEPEPYEILHGT